MHLSGDLADQYGEFITSDSLGLISGHLNSGFVNVVRDRHFYENIGKYDQFVGGWDDPFDNPFDGIGKWYTIKKDNVESIILTRQKDYYRNLRNDSNNLKHRAKNAVYTLMLNHLISGLEAGWQSQKKYSLYPKINFYYNMQDTYGVQGVKISYEW